MVTVAPAILLSAALLLALVLNLAIKPAFSGKLTTAFLLVSALGGLIFYGAGYMELTGDLVQTVVRTPLSVMRMFLGVNEMSSIAGSRLVSIPVGVILFWLAHLLAFASVASAALNTLSATAMRQLRFLLSRRGDLTLIYGINENSIALGKECLAAGGSSVVFITESAPASLIAELNGAGMSVLEADGLRPERGGGQGPVLCPASAGCAGEAGHPGRAHPGDPAGGGGHYRLHAPGV